MKRVRSFLWCLPLLAACFLPLAGADLTGHIPAGSHYAVELDAASLRLLPFYRAAVTENGSAVAYLQSFEESWGVRFEETDRLMLLGNQLFEGLLARTALTEARLAARLKARGGYSLQAERGHRVHCLTDSLGFTEMTLGITYLAPDVVFAAKRPQFATFLAAMEHTAGQTPTLPQLPRGTPLAWGYFDMKALIAERKNGVLPRIFNGVDSIFAEVHQTAGGTGLRFDGTAQCKNPAAAKMFAATLPMWLQLGAAFLFIDDAALGSDIRNLLIIEQTNAQVRVELELPKALLDRLGVYLREQAVKRFPPPDTADGFTWNRRLEK